MKKVVLLATTLLALTAASSTATAGGQVQDAAASTDCTSLFSPLASLTGSTARGPFKEPVLKAGPSDSNIPGNGPKTSASFATTVPTFVHVVTNGDEGFVDEATIAEQMMVLNLAFAGFYGDEADETGFQFDLRGITYTDNAAWFDAEPGAPEEFEMKAALKQGGATTLNIYLTNAAGQQLLGWAYSPKINVFHKKAQVLDGLVVNYLSLPGGPFGSAFSLGQTATHEAGHWLGLPHTFEQGCIGHGDYVDDTPAMLVPTSGCPEGKDTCPEAGLDPIHNFMDYSFDSCYEEFTAGQSDRMQKQWLHWRVQRA
jgi:hypothetical protein